MANVKNVSAKHPPKPQRKANGLPLNGNHLPWLLLKSFGCGAGAALLLCTAAAQVFAHTAISLELVKPAACGSVAVGAMLSGLLLANGVAQKRLLCGAAYGAFYALCLVLATVLSGNELVFDHMNLYLLAGMMLGGIAGGILSAMSATAGSSTPRSR